MEFRSSMYISLLGMESCTIRTADRSLCNMSSSYEFHMTTHSDPSLVIKANYFGTCDSIFNFFRKISL